MRSAYLAQNSKRITGSSCTRHILRHIGARGGATAANVPGRETTLLQLDSSISKTPFFVSGFQRLKEPFKLFYQSSSSQENRSASEIVQGLNCLLGVAAPHAAPCDAKTLELDSGPVTQFAVRQLLQAAQPAPFGRGGFTVLDPSYRNAHELKAGTFALGASLPTPEMLSDIASLMQPSAPQIHAQLHKVNIYGPGGMFKAHVDTPVSNAQFGSLVVALPCAFEGGELVVSHAGQTATLPLGSGAADESRTAAAGAAAGPFSAPPRGPLLHFAAFFSDCRHEVLPVTSGHRITLTYNLLASNAAEQARGPAGRLLTTVRPLAGGSSPLVAELRSLLGQAEWQPKGKTLGYALQHRYATSLTDLNDRMFPGILKGGDRLLYAALCQELGLKGRFVPIHLTKEGYRRGSYYVYDWEDEDEGEDQGAGGGKGVGDGSEWAPDVVKWVYVGRNFDIDGSMIGRIRIDDYRNYREVLRDCNFRPATEMDIMWMGLRGDDPDEAFYLQSQLAAYGNEATVSTVYSGVALLVKLPAWGTPERAAAMA